MERLDLLDLRAHLERGVYLECLVFQDQRDTAAFPAWMEPRGPWVDLERRERQGPRVRWDQMDQWDRLVLAASVAERDQQGLLA